MTEIRLPFAGRPDSRKYITLSSSGFPDPGNLQTGATLHFVDTGEEYICYGGMWERDFRKTQTLETAY